MYYYLLFNLNSTLKFDYVHRTLKAIYPCKDVSQNNKFNFSND